jgi:outer membrane immunogenic protein
MRQALRVASLCFTAFGFCSVASAADMALKAPPPAPVYYNWSGFYLGVNVGGSWGHQSDEEFVAGAPVAVGTAHPNGVIGGGQIGYNWQFNSGALGNAWVLGFEADFQGTSERAGDSFALATGTSGSFNDKLDWFGTVRGRTGIAFNRVLPYVTGGWAYGDRDFNGTVTTPAGAASFSNSNTLSGWTVGGGIEWAFWDHWTAKFEYLYIDFGNGSNFNVLTTPAVGVTTGHLTDNIARAGVNYKF